MDADVLNKLETYPQLTARAARIGYTINKVQWGGGGIMESSSLSLRLSTGGLSWLPNHEAIAAYA